MLKLYKPEPEIHEPKMGLDCVHSNLSGAEELARSIREPLLQRFDVPARHPLVAAELVRLVLTRRYNQPLPHLFFAMAVFELRGEGISPTYFGFGTEADVDYLRGREVWGGHHVVRGPKFYVDDPFAGPTWWPVVITEDKELIDLVCDTMRGLEEFPDPRLYAPCATWATVRPPDRWYDSLGSLAGPSPDYLEFAEQEAEELFGKVRLPGEKTVR